jgi:hypothetical protein
MLALPYYENFSRGRVVVLTKIEYNTITKYAKQKLDFRATRNRTIL